MNRDELRDKIAKIIEDTNIVYKIGTNAEGDLYYPNSELVNSQVTQQINKATDALYKLLVESQKELVDELMDTTRQWYSTQSPLANFDNMTNNVVIATSNVLMQKGIQLQSQLSSIGETND